MYLLNPDLYIAFFLNNEEYGIDISYTQEVLRIKEKIIKVPNMPYYVEGIINLREKVIPVVNLNKRFQFENNTEISDNSRLLIVNLDNTVLALIVDDVSEIISFEENSIENLNPMITQICQNSIKGIGKIDDRLIILLDALKLNADIFTSTTKGEIAI